jgi:DNA (cytosine-5)-methyltransferase 1
MDTSPKDSTSFSGRWPKQGMTVGGVAYELPMSAPPIDVSACSSLLPTPTACEPVGDPARWADKTKSRELSDCVAALLPTPTVNDSRGGRNRTANRLNPNPSNNSGTTLCDVAYDSSWGKYAAAVHRWESLTRPAPCPTEPNAKGGRRLHPPFVEWMMGLPQGWVTDIDIPRTAQLKALGNGVVSRQAAVALADLLS